MHLPATIPAHCLVAICLLLLAAPRAQGAGGVVSFEEVLAIPFTITGDIASDGAGTAVVVGYQSLSGRDILFRRTTDSGATWSAPAILNDESTIGAGTDSAPNLATDGTSWVAVWAFSVAPPGPGYESDIVFARSLDGGATWTVADFLDPAGAGLDTRDDLPGDLVRAGGTWLVSWLALDDAAGTQLDEVRVARSVDAGVTWSGTVAVGTSQHDELDSASLPRLAGDGAGTWILVWDSILGSDHDVLYAKSTDDGQTWSAPQTLAPNAVGDSGADREPDVATDGWGRWLTVWSSDESLGDPGVDSDIFLSRSTDAGGTWSAPEQLTAVPLSNAGLDFSPAIASDGAESWVIAWGSSAFSKSAGGDGEALFVRSRDGGVGWSTPSVVNNGAGADAQPDVPLEVVLDADGTCYVAWYSLGVTFSRSVPDCPVLPAPGCKQAGTSRVRVRDDILLKDQFLWRWTNGELTDAADLGEPTATSDYVVCLYETAGANERLAYEEEIRAGGTCGSRPCWKAAGSGFRYRDGALARGAVSSLRLTAGSAGQASFSLKAKGVGVAPPFLPLAEDAPARAQLHNLETGACWESVLDDVHRNDAARYQAGS